MNTINKEGGDELVEYCLTKLERSLKYSIPECYHQYLWFWRSSSTTTPELSMHITTNLHPRLIKQMFGGMFMSITYDNSFSIVSIEKDKENTFKIKVSINYDDDHIQVNS